MLATEETKNMQQHISPFVSELDELQNNAPFPSSSHGSSIQDRLVNYGSEALDKRDPPEIAISVSSKPVSFDG